MTSRTAKREIKSYMLLQDSFITRYIKRKIADTFLWKEAFTKKKTQVSYLLSLSTDLSKDNVEKKNCQC